MSSSGLIGFDLDGTLVDSAAGIHASLLAACTALDVTPPSRDALQTRIGPPLREYLPGLLGLTEAERDRLLEPLLNAFRQHHDLEGWALFRLYEGVLELLQTLQAEGWQLHVVTLKPAPLAAQVLERSGIGSLVQSLHAPQPGGRIHKAACLQRLRQPGLPVHCYVGDTAGDQRAAAEAGYGFIAAGYGYGGDLDAVHRISSPLDLLQALATG
ncbi:MAG: HAD hydrolase-like protein [Synechococcus sp. ELA057]